ncbi:VWA domain-containing protein [Terasakiella pusilla]|uniref:VWA domain-containing protein n=1 Tax=Terasakiella pusilla TaxID=64973 RepID=UPI003AA7C6D1
MSRRYFVAQQINSNVIGENEIWADAPLSSRLREVLRTHLSDAHANLFAEPEPSPSGRETNWNVEFPGMVEPVSSLPLDQQEALRRDAAMKLADIENLSARLPDVDSANADLAPALERACRYKGDPCLFSVGGQPVLTYWGYGDVTAAALPLAPAVQPVTTDAMPQQPVQEDLPWYRRLPVWLRWGLLALLILLFLLLLWWLVTWFLKDDPVQETLQPPIETPASPVTEPTPELPAAQPERPFPTQPLQPPPENVVPPVTPPSTVSPQGVPNTLEERAAIQRSENLSRQVDQLEEQLRLALAACQMPTDGSVPDLTPIIPQGPETVEKPIVAEPDLTNEPVTPPPPPPAEVPSEPVEEAKPEPSAPEPEQAEPVVQQAECPDTREPWEAPEVVVVFDVSGSMAFGVNEDPQYINTLTQRANNGDRAALMELSKLSRASGPTRLDYAKNAVNQMVGNLPKDVAAGLILFGSCGGTVNNDFYEAARRPEMMATINGLKPQDGTPLARAIERAGNIITGDVKESVILVISDGQDSCGGDPCQAAQAIARAKPGVVINVVDIGGVGAGSCLAQATGGKIINVDDMSQISGIVEQAAGQVAPAHCTR